MTRTDILNNVKQLLIETLSLDASPAELEDDMLLLGNVPEFDSMAIVSVITALEEQFGFVAEDDELSAEVFESIDSLVIFVESKIL